jgi:hypothetical protein
MIQILNLTPPNQMIQSSNVYGNANAMGSNNSYGTARPNKSATHE